MRTFTALALFATGALAQSSVLTTALFNLEFDDSPVVSIISSDPSDGAVTYLVACAASDIADDSCGLPKPGLTLTQGPSTYHYAYVDPVAGANFTFTEDCVFSGTTQAVCVDSAGGTGADTPGVSTTTYRGSQLSYGTVTVTEGLEKLSATAGAASTSGSASAAATAQSGSRTSAGASRTGSAASSMLSSAAKSASSAASSATSTGGAAHLAAPIVGVAGVVAAIFAL